jgi:hypothetical protein
MDTPRRLEFLKQVHLFNGLSDQQVAAVAETLSEHVYSVGEAIFEQGQLADSFFLIYNGKVSLTRRQKQGEQRLNELVLGDFFGEEALLSRQPRPVTVRAEESTVLLRLSREKFHELLETTPRLKTNLQVSVDSRRLAAKMHFNWLREDERVYFLGRRHGVFLVQSLVFPFILLGVPLFLLMSFLASGFSLLAILAVVLTLLIFVWGVWKAIDWGNDYYIVTNQRVVWLEKVIGIYDSREEAPLDTLLSVDVQASLSGRLLDFGNVVVHTFVGKIPLMHVRHPYQAKLIVEEQWSRSKGVSQEAEKKAMEKAIREKLGLSTPQSAGEAQPTTTQQKPPVPSLYKPGLGQRLASNLLKVRFEDDGNTVTYRKHWFVLVRQTWLPVITTILLFVLALERTRAYYHARATAMAGNSPNGIWPTVLIAGFLLACFWVWYRYTDWKNDVFQVTPDEVVDIDRKPLGTEQRRAAPLENILSTEYERKGLLGYMFNFGTVYIVVGSARLGFEDVFDPAAVQQDIDRRRLSHLAQKKASEAQAERERLAEWLATYHRSTGELRGIEEFPGNDLDPK